MRDFHELNWSEGTEAVLGLISRLTVIRGIREKEPMKRLSMTCAAMTEGNIRLAVDSLFSMTSALLAGKYRRVTGDLFKDFLLNEIFLSPHPFALMAASNRIDEAIYSLMKEDLDVLLSLRGLDSEIIYRFIQERYHELRQKVSPQSDLSTRRAVAAWSGGPVRPPEEAMHPMPALPLFIPSEAPNWIYGEEELRDSYAADEALEEMYHRFIESELEWSNLNEDLWNFFASYGSGEFLRLRHFKWANGALAPIEETRIAAEHPLMEQEYRACLEHLIAFMRGDSAEPMQIVGAEGMGRTTMLFSLADELPELRFVYVPDCQNLFELAPLFDILRDQPLKFMVALDDAKIAGFAERLIPANILLAAVSSKPSPVFTRRVTIPSLKLEGFADLVTRLLDDEGIDLPREVIRSACVDHQVESKNELTVAAAVKVAGKLKN